MGHWPGLTWLLLCSYKQNVRICEGKITEDTNKCKVEHHLKVLGQSDLVSKLEKEHSRRTGDLEENGFFFLACAFLGKRQ